MKTRTSLSLGLSALVLGGSMVGCAANGGGIASASDRASSVNARAAADNATRAARALARRDALGAVPRAEAAVALAPRSADYRSLLGRSYLQAGRFQSARAAFADALSLSPNDGKVALNLALSQIAVGDWQAARRTLDANATTIPAGDLGLAVALAGDPAGGVGILTRVARSSEASPKVRQNLALALALAGEWGGARVVAAADMSPADVDARLEQWAAFAKPASASDQVAGLLGVRPVEDKGLPVALALNAPVSPVQVAEQPLPPIADAPPAPVELAEVAPTVTAAPVVEHRQIAQTPRLIRAEGRAVKVAASVVRPIARGNWYVQIGAFGNAGVARDAWGRATRRYASFRGRVPTGMKFANKAGAFYRLSVGGFARGDADATCRRYRAAGGVCFVRAGAGDQVASWVRKTGVQFASR